MLRMQNHLERAEGMLATTTQQLEQNQQKTQALKALTEDQKRELRELRADMERDRRTFDQERQELTGVRDQMERDLDQHIRLITSMKREAAKLSAEQMKLRHQEEVLHRERDELREERERLGRALKDATGSRSKQHRELDQCYDRQQQLDQKMSALQQRLDEVSTERDAVLAAERSGQRELKALRKEYTKVTNEVGTLSLKVRSITETIERCQTETVTKDVVLREMKQRYEELLHENTRLIKELEELGRIRSDEQVEHAAVRQEHEQLQEREQQLLGTIQGYHDQFHSCSQGLDEAQSQMTSIDEELKAKTKDLRRLDRELTTTLKALNASKEELHLAYVDRDRLDARLQDSDASLHQRNAEVETLRAENADLSRTIEALETSLGGVSGMKERKARLKNLESTFRNRLKELLQRHETTVSELEHSQRQEERTREQLAKTTTRLGQLEQERAELQTQVQTCLFAGEKPLYEGALDKLQMEYEKLRELFEDQLRTTGELQARNAELVKAKEHLARLHSRQVADLSELEKMATSVSRANREVAGMQKDLKVKDRQLEELGQLTVGLTGRIDRLEAIRAQLEDKLSVLSPQAVKTRDAVTGALTETQSDLSQLYSKFEDAQHMILTLKEQNALKSQKIAALSELIQRNDDMENFVTRYHQEKAALVEALEECRQGRTATATQLRAKTDAMERALHNYQKHHAQLRQRQQERIDQLQARKVELEELLRNEQSVVHQMLEERVGQQRDQRVIPVSPHEDPHTTAMLSEERSMLAEVRQKLEAHTQQWYQDEAEHERRMLELERDFKTQWEDHERVKEQIERDFEQKQTELQRVFRNAQDQFRKQTNSSNVSEEDVNRLHTEFQRLTQEHERRMSDIEKERDARTKEFRSAQRVMRQRKEDAVRQLQEARARHQAEFGEARRLHTEQMQRLSRHQQDYEALQQKARDEQLALLSDLYGKKRGDLDRELQQRRLEHDVRVQDLDEEIVTKEKLFDQAVRDHNNILKHLSEEEAEEKEKMMQEQHRLHELALREHREEQRHHVEEMKRLEQEHAQRMRELTEKEEAHKREELTALEQKHKDMVRVIEEERHRKEAEFVEIEHKHRETLARMTDEAVQERRRQIDQMKAEHAEALARLSRERDERQQEFQQLQRQYQTQEQQWSDRVKEHERAFQERATAQEQEFQGRVQALKDQYQQQQRELERQTLLHRQRMEELERERVMFERTKQERQEMVNSWKQQEQAHEQRIAVLTVTEKEAQERLRMLIQQQREEMARVRSLPPVPASSSSASPFVSNTMRSFAQSQADWERVREEEKKKSLRKPANAYDQVALSEESAQLVASAQRGVTAMDEFLLHRGPDGRDQRIQELEEEVLASRHSIDQLLRTHQQLAEANRQHREQVHHRTLEEILRYLEATPKTVDGQAPDVQRLRQMEARGDEDMQALLKDLTQLHQIKQQLRTQMKMTIEKENERLQHADGRILNELKAKQGKQVYETMKGLYQQQLPLVKLEGHQQQHLLQNIRSQEQLIRDMERSLPYLKTVTQKTEPFPNLQGFRQRMDAMYNARVGEIIAHKDELQRMKREKTTSELRQQQLLDESRALHQKVQQYLRKPDLRKAEKIMREKQRARLKAADRQKELYFQRLIDRSDAASELMVNLRDELRQYGINVPASDDLIDTEAHTVMGSDGKPIPISAVSVTPEDVEQLRTTVAARAKNAKDDGRPFLQLIQSFDPRLESHQDMVIREFRLLVNKVYVDEVTRKKSKINVIAYTLAVDSKTQTVRAVLADSGHWGKFQNNCKDKSEYDTDCFVHHSHTYKQLMNDEDDIWKTFKKAIRVDQAFIIHFSTKNTSWMTMVFVPYTTAETGKSSDHERSYSERNTEWVNWFSTFLKTKHPKVIIVSDIHSTMNRNLRREAIENSLQVHRFLSYINPPTPDTSR